MKVYMRRMFLMVGTVLALGLAVNAQTSQQYRGTIPFDFEAGGKHFSAGDYSLGPRATNNSVGVLSLQERKGKRKMASLGLVSLNSGNSSTKGQLIFAKRNGTYALTQIITPTFAANMKRTWTDVKVSRKDAPAVETVAILLQ